MSTISTPFRSIDQLTLQDYSTYKTPDDVCTLEYSGVKFWTSFNGFNWDVETNYVTLSPYASPFAPMPSVLETPPPADTYFIETIYRLVYPTTSPKELRSRFFSALDQAYVYEFTATNRFMVVTSVREKATNTFVDLRDPDFPIPPAIERPLMFDHPEEMEVLMGSNSSYALPCSVYQPMTGHTLRVSGPYKAVPVNNWMELLFVYKLKSDAFNIKDYAAQLHPDMVPYISVFDIAFECLAKVLAQPESMVPLIQHHRSRFWDAADMDVINNYLCEDCTVADIKMLCMFVLLSPPEHLISTNKCPPYEIAALIQLLNNI